MKRASLILIVALVGCRAARTDAPKRTDSIKFSHDFHAKMDFDCETCHKGISAAASLEKTYLPREATCLECHAEQKETGACDFCHSDPKHPATFERQLVSARLPHDKHVNAKVACSTCHVKLAEPGSPTVTKADHEACFSCHEHKKTYAAGDCGTCHEDLGRFPVAPVAAFNHGGNFLKTHGAQARTSAETCAKCHDQTSCAECHAKTVGTRVEVKFPEDVAASFIHRGDYVTRHALEARADSTTCARCHGTSFCESCHALNNLTPQVAGGARNPHPTGWSFPGSSDFHGRAARNDIASCAACHDQGQASVCVSCHKVGGVGGNPHPASWLGRHDAKEISGNGMCQSCH